MSDVRPPAAAPCVSCPYRRDVPSGVWDASEYEKLPPYDGPTWDQPHGLFMCHQQDGRLCAGWVGCHDMQESFAVRVAALRGTLTADDLEEVLDYATDVPLFASGAEAAAHGFRELESPDGHAVRVIGRIAAKRPRDDETAPEGRLSAGRKSEG